MILIDTNDSNNDNMRRATLKKMEPHIPTWDNIG